MQLKDFGLRGSVILNVALIVIGTVATLSAFGGETWRKGNGPLSKRVTLRGWISLSCLFLALVLGGTKEYLSLINEKKAQDVAASLRVKNAEFQQKIVDLTQTNIALSNKLAEASKDIRRDLSKPQLLYEARVTHDALLGKDVILFDNIGVGDGRNIDEELFMSLHFDLVDERLAPLGSATLPRSANNATPLPQIIINEQKLVSIAPESTSKNESITTRDTVYSPSIEIGVYNKIFKNLSDEARRTLFATYDAPRLKIIVYGYLCSKISAENTNGLRQTFLFAFQLPTYTQNNLSSGAEAFSLLCGQKEGSLNFTSERIFEDASFGHVSEFLAIRYGLYSK